MHELPLIFNPEGRVAAGKKHGIITQGEYEKVIANIATIRLNKVIAYGEDRYNETDEEFNYWMCYSDVYRKYIRIKTLTKAALKKGADGESLIDTYKDLANYAIMAIQILEKKDVQN